MIPRKEGQPITYLSTGVDYDAMDPLKRNAQLKARETAGNLERVGYREIEASRGESAYVWEESDAHRAFVIEGLGTKNRVADETRKITGHGWRKLMRANRDFTYVIDEIPEPQPVFKFIQEQSRNDDREMYGNFNMGAGFAVFVPQEYVEQAQVIGRQHSLNILNAGVVQEGPKQVIIKPKNNLVFNELGVR